VKPSYSIIFFVRGEMTGWLAGSEGDALLVSSKSKKNSEEKNWKKKKKKIY
tara:strand:+ start:573 stop:725 length:153 start_codon:yes stop_codon:yes gene_type:complete